MTQATPFTLAPLPYAQDALAPVISANTLSFHHGKHHATYVDNLNKLVAGTPMEKQSLEEIIKASAGVADKKGLFNNAAQVWNHDFFWHSMKPNGGAAPSGALAERINAAFGTFDTFREKFIAAGLAQFGSGWVWLVADASGKLSITTTGNAELPLTGGQKALLTADVWEHAYYLDYQNRRKDFLTAFVDKLANWDFAAKNLG